MSSILLQVIVSGLLIGAVYALFSSGLTLIWGMMNVINFAHGDFVMLAMYTAFIVWTVFGGGPARGRARSRPWCWRPSGCSATSCWCATS